MMGKVLKINFWLSILLTFVALQSSGQQALDTVLISETKSFTYGHLLPDKVSNDTSYSHILDFIQSINGGQLQQSTMGGLVTFLHRGMGNRHLPIMWNGVNLQSMTNGSYDLGLIPWDLFDKVEFYNSGSPSLQGNNGLAGSLNIDHQKSATSTKISSYASTLTNFGLTLKKSWLLKKMTVNMGAALSRDNNIYEYSFANTDAKRASTDFNKSNVITKVQYFLTSRQFLSGEIWWQSSDRVIPQSITSGNVIQHQKDVNLRSNLTHYYQLSQISLTSSASYIDEKLNFSAPGIDSRSHAKALILSCELAEIEKNNHFASIKYRKDVATPNFYTQSKSRNTIQLSVAKNKKWSKSSMTNLAVRQDMVDGKMMPTSITIHTAVKKSTLQVARNYNLPGFNDLYWPVGGNPELRAEVSLKAEMTTTFQLAGWRWRTSVYSNLVDNWIQWMPQSSGLWMAVNQKKVYSRGCEINTTSRYQMGYFTIVPTLEYAYNKTTAIEHYFDPALIGKQLIYIPAHKVKSSIQVLRQHHQLKLEYDLTGTRYDTPDNTQKLTSLHLLNVRYNYLVGKWKYMISVYNIFNRNYQVVRYFPMPGINAEIKISFTI